MLLDLCLTKKVKFTYQPLKRDLLRWIKLSLVGHYSSVAIDCSIVNQTDAKNYNQQLRNCDYPTNVIAIAYNHAITQNSVSDVLYGAIILCDAIIVLQAATANKPIIEHYAHMVIHAMLHLQGFTHDEDEKAQKMEALENKIMQQLNFRAPYI